MTIPTNRVRAKKPKTKTGCRTCRTRRIKCDEKRPACYGCVSSGWICDGYASEGSSTQLSATNTRTAGTKPLEAWISSLSFARPWYLPLSRLTYQEGLAFTFFRQHTASQFQDGMKSQLWDRWAMQISHQQPAILHAIVAVGAMHNARSNPADVSFSKLQQLALVSYSKAVVELRDSMSKLDNHAEVDIVLLACILFVGFEMLKHEISLAMEHLRLGLKLMTYKYTTKTSLQNMSTGSIAIKGSPTTLLDELVPIFVRLDYGAPMFGRRHRMLDLVHDEYNLQHSLSVPTSFDSVHQAKSYLDLLSSGVFRLRGELLDIAEKEALDAGLLLLMGPNESACYLQARSRSVDLGRRWNEILARKHALETGMAAFWRALDAYMESVKTSTDRAAIAVQIQYCLVFFTITNCRETYESCCDGYTDLFEHAIDLAEKYITSAPGFPQSTGKRNLSLEPGVMPTIYLVASKCRHPAIRARAIELMEIGCRQEAIWDGKPFAAFMQYLSNLETELATIYSDMDVVLSCDGHRSGSDAPPECARFCDVVIADELDRLGRGILFCARYRHETDGLIDIVEHKVTFGDKKVKLTCANIKSTSTLRDRVET